MSMKHVGWVVQDLILRGILNYSCAVSRQNSIRKFNAVNETHGGDGYRALKKLNRVKCIKVYNNGEAFWGGIQNIEDRSQLIVQPLIVEISP